MPNREFFTSRGAYVNGAIIAMLYTQSELVYSISRDERDAPLTQYITNA